MKKNNWTKRGLAALVALGMCLGMTNLSAFAAGEYWGSDSGWHWKCDQWGTPLEEGDPHVDANNDGTCDVCSYSGMPIIPTIPEWPDCEHEWMLNSDATGKEDGCEGGHSLYCPKCHDSKTESHTPSDDGKCTVCGKEVFTPEDSNDKHEHKCGAFNWDETDHWDECEICGEVILKKPHDWKEAYRIDATCTEDGEIKYECTTLGCNASYDEKISAHGHKCGTFNWDEADHWDECEICGEVILKKPHDWKEAYRIDATCTEDGEIKYECTTSGCNASYDEKIPALGHVCGELKWDGEQHWTECDRCSVVIGEKKDHEWTEVSRKDATCTEPGEIKYDCNLLGCNASKDVEIPALGHELEAILQGATCTDPGLTGVKCTRPGCDYRDEIPADAIGHDYKIIEQIEGDSENHLLICGNDESHTEFAPHAFGEWQIVRAATETEDGLEQHVCADCGCEETRPIPATGTGDDDTTPTTPVTPVIPDDDDDTTPTTPVTPVIPDDDDDDTPTTPVTPVIPDDDDDDDDTPTTPVTPTTPGDDDDDDDTPVVTIPDADVPMAETPAVDDDVRMPDAPEVSIPDADVPLADVPEVSIPDVDVPLAGAPEVTVPDEDVPLADAPEAEIPDADVPLADIPEMNVPLADMPMEIAIPDEEVPLADVPKTGDNSQVWALFALASGAGLAWLALSETRRKADAE